MPPKVTFDSRVTDHKALEAEVDHLGSEFTTTEESYDGAIYKNFLQLLEIFTSSGEDAQPSDWLESGLPIKYQHRKHIESYPEAIRYEVLGFAQGKTQDLSLLKNEESILQNIRDATTHKQTRGFPPTHTLLKPLQEALAKTQAGKGNKDFQKLKQGHKNLKSIWPVLGLWANLALKEILKKPGVSTATKKDRLQLMAVRVSVHLRILIQAMFINLQSRAAMFTPVRNNLLKGLTPILTSVTLTRVGRLLNLSSLEKGRRAEKAHAQVRASNLQRSQVSQQEVVRTLLRLKQEFDESQKWAPGLFWLSLVSGARLVEAAEWSMFEPITQEEVEAQQSGQFKKVEHGAAKFWIKQKYLAKKRGSKEGDEDSPETVQFMPNEAEIRRQEERQKHKLANKKDFWVIKPLLGLTQAEEFLETVQKVRALIRAWAKKKKWDPTHTSKKTITAKLQQSIQRWLQTAQPFKDAPFKVTFKSTRALYANMAVAEFMPPQMTSNVYIGSILGHDPDNRTTAFSYEIFNVHKELTIEQRGVLDKVTLMHTQMEHMYKDFLQKLNTPTPPPVVERVVDHKAVRKIHQWDDQTQVLQELVTNANGKKITRDTVAQFFRGKGVKIGSRRAWELVKYHRSGDIPEPVTKKKKPQ